MSHEIDIHEGVANMFSVREKPWHNLGKILPEKLTSKEAIVEAGLDWQVEAQPILRYTHSGIETPIDDYYANVRTDRDTTLGIVGKKYEIVQNLDCFAFFDHIVRQDEAIFETAGSLMGGKVIWMLAKLPEHIKVNGDADLIEQYLLLTTGHDGYHPIQVMFTPIRVVCNNTLNFAQTRNERKITIRHTASAKEEIQIAHKVMGITNQLSNELSAMFNMLTEIEISEQQFINYIMQVFMNPAEERLYFLQGQPWENILSTRKKNIINKVIESYMNNENNGGIDYRGTAWGAYNAVTNYLHNKRDYTSHESQFKSELLGAGAQTAQIAYKLAADMVHG